MSDEEDRSVLEQRARLLARPRRDTQRVHALVPFAIFERGGVDYAIHPRFVFEVARALAPTPLPLAAAHWLGVTSLHGELLAMADLGLLLDASVEAPLVHPVGHDPSDADRRSCLVLVLGVEHRELGLLIDAVYEAKALPDEIARLPLGDPEGQLVVGTTADGVHVLHGEALLSDPRLFIRADHSSEA